MNAEPERTQGLSEKDAINVIERVLNENPVDPPSMFLTGRSMGSSGTWYLGAKRAQHWAAIAPMSGPFVDESNYPLDGNTEDARLHDRRNRGHPVSRRKQGAVGLDQEARLQIRVPRSGCRSWRHGTPGIAGSFRFL